MPVNHSLIMIVSIVESQKTTQDQGASVQKTVWTVKRCIHGDILSPVLVVVGCSGLYWAVQVDRTTSRGDFG